MDLRTKFVFALVAVALASMLALGAFTYGAVRELLRGMAERQLAALAESKKEDLEKVVVAWKDRVQLIASGAQLRESLLEHRRDREAAAAEIGPLIDDWLRSLRALRGITVYSPDGYPIASAGFTPWEEERLHPATFFLAQDPVAYENVFQDDDGRLVIAFVSPVHTRGRKVGAVKVLLSASELIAVTDDRTGMGETGEIVMALRTEEGGARVVNPLRHDPEAALRLTIPLERGDDPLVQAVSGVEATLRDARDYRDEPVWVATRTLDELGWGLAVKIDAAEEERTVTELRDTLIRLALSLSAFAIVAGTLLGLYFARPIRELAEVARRIGDGDLDARAREDSEDEIGMLAATFNRMAEELIEKNRELERRVKEQGR